MVLVRGGRVKAFLVSVTRLSVEPWIPRALGP